MGRRILFFLLIPFCLCSLSSFAQQYCTDAVLVSDNGGKVAKIKSSGIGDKKKTATEMAVKSAIWTYLNNGISGLNGDAPLLGRHPSEASGPYVNQLMESGRWTSFVKSYVVDNEQKTLTKDFQITVTMELYTEALYKDLLNCKVIGLDPEKTDLKTASAEISLPSIMVVPYVGNGGDFSSVIQENAYMRMAISKVNTGLIKRGVETKDIEQMIRNAETYQATHYDMSINDMILANSGADVAVYVDISGNVNTYGTAVNMIMTAIDIATGNTYASSSQNAPRKNASAEVICAALTEVMLDDFLKQVEVGFAKKISGGNAIAVSFTIDPMSCVTFDTEIGNDFTPLSDAIFQWIRRNAKDGKFHSQGRTKTTIVLDDIRIANKNDDGTDMDINDFSLSLYRFLRSNNLIVERNITGNRIDLIIK
ncbi:MAG: hypothetical protein E7111_02480 [Bacteroidales bacterium]|nr:hypothetical protein [Bacteroidales bacterium]